ncbi:hypothetical protein M3672_15000 [Microbacterium enclense]|uniref:hypothetical protein n=1 Tax=Microbacterium enclense TaxID=993073 RepID=UPI0020406B28|nr:hypothetical protein [Microbacterium enclense]MCM3615738.1 hypothetical protein [Microbacterium enclense]
MTTTVPDFDIFPTIAPKRDTPPPPRSIVVDVPRFNPPVEHPLPPVPEVVFAQPEPPAPAMPEPVADPLPKVPRRDMRMLAAERTLFASLPARARRRRELKPPTRTAFDLGDEEGAALATVIVLMVVIGFVITALFMNLQAGTTQTALIKSELSSRVAAESGQDVGLWSAMQLECEPTGKKEEFGYSYELHGSDFKTQPPTGDNLFGAHAGCPETGDYYLLVKTVGVDGRGREKEVVSVYQWGDGTEETTFNTEATERTMPTLITRTES